MVNIGDKLAMNINGTTFRFIVNNIDLFNKGDDNMYGIFNDLSLIDIKSNTTNIRLKNNTTTNQLFNENTFDFKNLDIGGLNSELSTIFRRVFASRVLPASLIEKLDIKHPKGVIFYGPPGTGKTLTARNLSKSLKAKSIQIINGPELINSYVGKSEENVRNLFKQAEAEKDQEGLHVIIFDEFDSLCKKRGETSGVSGDVNDKIVTQLLSKIDGYDSLNNILLIGMTNRIDLLDPAILRPGRFEVHIEISLPNEEGRIEILNIHTKKLKENKCLDDSVDINEIAKHTKNYTGAELEGLVRDARSYAINKLINIDKLDKTIKMEDILITQAHFMKAIESYIPKFGTSEIDISYYMPKGIIDYNDEFVSMKDNLLMSINAFTTNDKQLYSILLGGQTGSGKTAYSAYLARKTNYPFIKVISNNDMIGFSESAKIHYIKEIFEQAYISEIGVIVIDSIETIVEYYRDNISGSLRFLPSLFNSLKTLIRKIPIKKHHKLLLISNYDDTMSEYDKIVDIRQDMPLNDGVVINETL